MSVRTDNLKPWEGSRLCEGTTKLGTQCGIHEIEGLGYCLHHVPDDMLEEAEEMMGGTKRCRRNFGKPGACTALAVAGTDPPRCVNHGAAEGSGPRMGATQNIIEGKVVDRLTQILAEHGEKLLAPDPIGDPLQELLDLAAEVKAGKEMLRQLAAQLYSQDRIRYAHSKVGEQLRMEIILYERSLERLAHLLIQISKLNIDERLAGIKQHTLDMMERALDLALEEAGTSLERKQPAKEAFRRGLRVVA